MSTKLTARLNYSSIFNDKETVEELLKKVDIKRSLETLAIINKFQHKIHEDEKSEINFIINDFLENCDKEIKDKVVNGYIKVLKKNQEKTNIQEDLSSIRIINKLSTLRLTEILLSKKNTSITLKKEQNSVILLKLYLLVNQEIADRQDKVFKKYFKNKVTFLDDIHFHLFLGLSQAIEDDKISGRIITEVLKFIQFEKWLRKNEQYYNMTNDYLKQIGLNSWYEYFNDVFSVNSIAAITHIISTKDYPVLSTILNFYSSENNFNSDWSDLINLKKNPILKKSNHEFIVLDLGYTLSKFFTGIYHEILFFSKELFKGKFSQDYNTLFLEEELLVNSIKLVFNKNYKKLSEKEIKSFEYKKGIENIGLPDYYIRNGNKVFLFECKNSFISNKNKVLFKDEEILKEIREKFYYSTKNGKRKKKAILQLQDFIKNLSIGSYDFFDQIEKKEKIIVYPILIVTDETLCTLGFNQLLNYYFTQEKDKGYLKDIRPLTVIHIDDFIKYQTHLKKLDFAIESYHDHLKKNNAIEKMISFSDYLDIELLRGKSMIDRKNVVNILKDSLLPSK